MTSESTASPARRSPRRKTAPARLVTPKGSRPPLDLALQGGGSHGAFTWGVLDRLLDEPDLRFADSLLINVANPSNGVYTLLVKANATSSFYSNATYTVRVQADDSNGGTFAKAFTITITLRGRARL